MPQSGKIFKLSMLSRSKLLHISYDTLINLGTDRGIIASGKEEVFGCIFGRDSAITIIKILNVLEKNNPSLKKQKSVLLDLCQRTLLTISGLVGQEINEASGEEPGKFIHEFRENNFEKLTDWYLYPGPVLKNYDSIDATPLGLVAIYRYYQITHDEKFLDVVMPAVKAGLKWIMRAGDRDHDYLLEYAYSDTRKGGLRVQSWMDSDESLRQADGIFPKYPIAPVEVQGYAFWALRLWSDYFDSSWPGLSVFAIKMRQNFIEHFIYKDKDYIFLAQALDGDKNQIRTVTGNPLLLLWATYEDEFRKEAIIDKEIIDSVVTRSFQKDLFDKTAGIRTMSSQSQTFNPGQDSYHNGSFWPKLNGLAYEGLLKWGYYREARILRRASLMPLSYFATPIELYVTGQSGEYLEYRNSTGQVSCRNQAWSAAAMLDFVSTKKPSVISK